MTVLVLGGTAEGRDLATRLADAGIDALTSLAGAVRDPKVPKGRVRIGGFGGAEGFRAVLAEERITSIIDASHPFAARITARSHEIAVDIGTPFLRIERPAWQQGPGDRWVQVDRLADAAPHIAPGARVFLATGRHSLSGAAGLAHANLYLRVIDPPCEPFPFPHGRYVVGRPPFSVESERTFFEADGIEVIVTKNAGGDLAKPKLIAARALGLPVLMLRRPGSPVCDRVATVKEALDWLGAPPPVSPNRE